MNTPQPPPRFVRVTVRLLLALVLLLTMALTITLPMRPPPIVQAAVTSQGYLPTTSGPSISDADLREMIDNHIPEGNAHSMLFVLTQCYAGDIMDNLDRDDMTVLSATEDGQVAWYGGYHDDAAEALKPGEDRTSDDVHEAGTAGKSSKEDPQSQGNSVSLAPTSADGPIQSRHVLVYAGDDSNAMDRDDCEQIEENFAGQENTTVSLVGCEATNDSNTAYPATRDGLNNALQTIGGQMNENEQFIMLVTDHGGLRQEEGEPECSQDGEITGCGTVFPPFSEVIHGDMLNDPLNEAGVGVTFTTEPTATLNIALESGSTFAQTNVPTTSFAFHGGNWHAFVPLGTFEPPLEEQDLDPESSGLGLTLTTSSYDTIPVDAVTLESGAIGKRAPRGSMAAREGARSIYDIHLRAMLDEYIPPSKSHSSLLIFTQCYAGAMMDDFAGREKTTALAAGSANEVTWYGGYHDDAAEALKPGTTSDDIHDAGTQGKNEEEHPQKQGSNVEIPSLQDGPSEGIQSRHVLVYAGQPEPLDEADCQNIENNFANEGSSTTVSLVGCNATVNGNQSYPATRDGLRDAIEDIGNQMNENEQFILFVTDHGDSEDAQTPVCSTEEGKTSCESPPLNHGDEIEADMENDPDNQPGIDIETDTNPGADTYSGKVGDISFEDVPVEALDINGDGDTDDPGEGYHLFIQLDDSHIYTEPVPFEIIPPYTPTLVTLETGEISKRYIDFGDAPDDIELPRYPTLLVHDGARHHVNASLRLGRQEDGESDGQPTLPADGDDIHGLFDDEDGVTFTSPLVPGTPAAVEVEASRQGKLDAWIDFNADDDWADSGDQIFASRDLVSGTNILTFTVPITASAPDTTYARFRLSSKGGLSYDGLARDGEVEDYTVRLDHPDLELAKTVTPTSRLRPGDWLTYTITYRNASSGKAENIQITDPVPPELTNASARASSADLVPITGTGDYAWSLPVLAPGNSGTITISGQISPTIAAVTTITNTATITSSMPDGDPTNNSASVQTTVMPRPILKLVVQPISSGTMRPGAMLPILFTFSNTGTISATGVKIVAIVPISTTFYAPSPMVTALSAAEWDCENGDPPGSRCTHEVGTLEPQASDSVTFTVKLDDQVPAGTQTISVTGQIYDDSGEDYESSENRDEATTEIEIESGEQGQVSIYLPLVVR